MVEGPLGQAMGEDPVGHDLEAGRGGDLEGVAGLVAGVVVDRVPAGGSVRLPGDQEPVVRAEEPAVAQRVAAHQPRHPVVPDPRDELVPVPDPPAGRVHDQLAGPPAPGGLPAVDTHRPHVQAVEVEVEAGEVLAGPRPHGRHTRDPARGGLVAQLQVVVPGVVPAVAVLREVGVAHAGRARSEALRTGRAGREPGGNGQRDGEERDEGRPARDVHGHGCLPSGESPCPSHAARAPHEPEMTQFGGRARPTGACNRPVTGSRVPGTARSGG